MRRATVVVTRSRTLGTSATSFSAGWGRLPRATSSTAAPLVPLRLQPSSAAQHVRRWSGGVLSSAAEGSTTGRARSWVVACGVNIARGVVGVTAFASTPRSPSSLVVRDGFVCTPDGKHAYLDQTKPVVVRRPTLWQRARYVVAKVMAAVLSAIGALYPASWLFFVQYKEVDIFTDSWDWLNATPALIAGPLVLFVAAAYMWYRGCGTYFTVPELATFRFIPAPAGPLDQHVDGQAMMDALLGQALMDAFFSAASPEERRMRQPREQTCFLGSSCPALKVGWMSGASSRSVARTLATCTMFHFACDTKNGSPTRDRISPLRTDGDAYAMMGVSRSSSVSASAIRMTTNGRLMMTTSHAVPMSVPTTTFVPAVADWKG
ncbi:uncharacterized protein ACA1_395410 [Acanthamoeba castellanii str. Neff]|uniref:Uncharacterized protein n=1 Tax=Acanthamoeba castellanii (strain ATCC 30010 / Neff) TaxID=1257118 RepID=L8H1S6_ACACF|nr:uncharacterized protein ACA1_395410 [Acanthamoeba castellanii str. Neff]ELR18713.1 hypothetical protein ACA1_395410 [Acanthamoeba castellanii str. Neff]